MMKAEIRVMSQGIQAASKCREKQGTDSEEETALPIP